MSREIAALYVAKNGPYFGVPGVTPYDEEKDARGYNGPHPVVAHPPCERWGKYYSGGPNPQAARRLLGDDGGCFDRALWAVRNFGGVLEHPAYSAAFRYYRLAAPDPAGGWHPAGDGYGAWVCQVHQGHYGHPADKATWLYAKAPRDSLPELIWGPCEGKVRIDTGYHSKEEALEARQESKQASNRKDYASAENSHAEPVPRHVRSYRAARERGMTTVEWMSSAARAKTPDKFREVLLNLARSA